MSEDVLASGLIVTRRRSAIALLLAVWFEARHLRDILRHTPRRPYFDEAFVTGDPVWLARAFNLIELGFLVFCIFFLMSLVRHSCGAERAYLAAWLISVLVALVKDFVSTPTVIALSSLQAFVWLAAIGAAVRLLIRLPGKSALNRRTKIERKIFTSSLPLRSASSDAASSARASR